MSRASRVRSIYVKELLETLRDKRTLLATVVLPLVLYPLMVIGFARIRSLEETALQDASYKVAVVDEPDAELLRELINEYQRNVDESGIETVSTGDGSPDAGPFPIFHVIVAQVGDDLIGTTFDARVEFTQVPDAQPEGIEDLGRSRLEAGIIYRPTEVHSDAAAAYLKSVFDWQFNIRRDRVIGMIQDAVRDSYPQVDIWAALSPVKVEQTSISTQEELGGWLFGQILPIILVIMTISGATYPAIDLTAGERERGTLETLLVAPVHPSELITGKFLVVTTIAMATAVLNVVSMGTTLQLGGVSSALGGPGGAASIPLHVFPIVLLCLLPFAFLSSALMLAVSCFARTFKEAQNYAMPVLIGSMVPAAVGLMQTMELKGAVLVMPIANLTLLTRDLFQGTWTWSAVLIVWLSTSLYAGAAVAVAAKLFGQESVTFADSFKFKTLLLRKWLPSRSLPSASQVLLPVAVLFPLVFYLQTGLHQHAGGDLVRFMRQWGVAQLLVFVGIPVAAVWYLKLDARKTFALRLPNPRAWVGAVLVGASAWVVASEIALLQTRVFGRGLQMADMQATMDAMLSGLGLFQALLLLAVLPGICEEFLFRGFLLSGVRGAAGKWGAILIVGVVFGLFHLYGFKLLVTALLGMLLAFVCWQTRSIWPGILIHAMHNGIAVSLAAVPSLGEKLHLNMSTETSHLPVHILIPGFLVFALGLGWIARTRPRPKPTPSRPAFARHTAPVDLSEPVT